MMMSLRRLIKQTITTETVHKDRLQCNNIRGRWMLHLSYQGRGMGVCVELLASTLYALF